jgi:hypothetical protein
LNLVKGRYAEPPARFNREQTARRCIGIAWARNGEEFRATNTTHAMAAPSPSQLRHVRRKRGQWATPPDPSLIGETGFEPATARPPACGIRWREATHAALLLRSGARECASILLGLFPVLFPAADLQPGERAPLTISISRFNGGVVRGSPGGMTSTETKTWLITGAGRGMGVPVSSIRSQSGTRSSSH